MEHSARRFVHISDLHFRAGLSGSQFDLDKDLRQRMESDLLRIVENLPPLDGVLLSGDIAFSGSADDYAVASDWLSGFCARIGCSQAAVWAVPGNHDVDRRLLAGSKSLRMARDKLRSCDTGQIDTELQEVLTDKELGATMFGPFQHFNSFVAPFSLNYAAGTPFWENELFLNDGSLLRIRGVNSAFISDANDDATDDQLVVGQMAATVEIKPNVTHLVICHHPPKWLRDQDVVEQIWKRRAHVQLFGHLHRQALQRVENSIQVFAGALHPSRLEAGWRPQYNLVGVEVVIEDSIRKLRVTTHTRAWHAEHQAFTQDGPYQRVDNLTLDQWSPSIVVEGVSGPKVSESVSGASTATVAVTEGVATPEPVVIQVSRDNAIGDHSHKNQPNRELAFRFLTLPYRKQLLIITNLGLVE